MSFAVNQFSINKTIKFMNALTRSLPVTIQTCV